MSGDLTLHDFGERVPVLVQADANGALPQRGDVVAIVGESERGTHVSAPANAGAGVALLTRDAIDTSLGHNETRTYAANEVVGQSMAKLRHPVDWFRTSEAYAAGAGDLVIFDAGGTVAAYDPTDVASGGAGHTADMIAGRVWRSSPHAEGTVGKAAVVRYR